MDRNIYLKTKSLEEALICFKEKTKEGFKRRMEDISVVEAFDRVTAEPIYALCSNPNYNASAMDGIAVFSKNTHLADERNPLRLKRDTDFIFVDTGDIIAEPYDSVIMIEDIVIIDDFTIEIMCPSYPWQHVRMIGEDFVIGEMLLTRAHKITAVDLGALVSGGISTIKVLARLNVGLIPTGSEIVEIGTALKPGDILESNTHMFSGLVTEGGGMPVRYPIVPDHKEKLKVALLTAVAENDIVIINAGSSAGSEDYTASLIAELGEVWVHGIDIKPGKPTILGSIQGKPVVGIPGYPVSAYMTFKHFVMPMLAQQNITHAQATLSQAIPSSLKHKEFVRVQLGFVNNKIVAVPLKRGAASTMSLVKANGILTIDKASEGYSAGSTVAIELTRNHLNLKKGLVAVGSHDLIMDWISDLLLEQNKDTHLLSAHTGSFGGLMALKRGEAHLAPIHLLDEETGLYNIKDVTRYLPYQDYVLVKGIRRWQGFYTKPTCDVVKGIDDIAQKRLTFVNRQKGSGTRILTDYLVKKSGVQKDNITGYQTEVLTHTAVALAVLAGNADVGIGIASVANQMGLGYYAIAKEDYDFLIPKCNLTLPVVRDFLDVLESDGFKQKLLAIGGYEMDAISYVDLGDSL